MEKPSSARKRNKGKGHPDEMDSPFGKYIRPSNLPAVRAYRLCCLALIPGLGLLLGPWALVVSWLAQKRCMSDPEFTAQGFLRVSYLLATLITLTNWGGLALMIYGLRGG
jgi:hypothetical protein